MVKCYAGMDYPSYDDLFNKYGAGDYLFVVKLSLKAPSIINEVKKQGGRILGQRGRWPNDDNVLRHITFGLISPNTMYFTTKRGAIVQDYSLFDLKSDINTTTEEEMYFNVNILFNEIVSPCPGKALTPSGIVSSLIKNPYAIGGLSFNPTEYEQRKYIACAMLGGANYIMPQFRNRIIPYEQHVDFHQMYASVMRDKNNVFPVDDCKVIHGYYAAKCAIYIIMVNSVKLRSSGFPIIPLDCCGGMLDNDTPMPLSLALTSVDLDTFDKNYEADYEVIDTIYWPNVMSGERLFADAVDKLYAGRLKHTNDSGKNIYKAINEYLPGCFEKTYYATPCWNKDYVGKKITEDAEENSMLWHNCKIGAFITAYGRRKLNYLLHQMPHSHIVGWDTDAVFFDRPILPYAVTTMLGDGIGQLHIDMEGRNSYHFASKQYVYEDDSGTIVWKLAGVSKDGTTWKYDRVKNTYAQYPDLKFAKYSKIYYSNIRK